MKFGWKQVAIGVGIFGLGVGVGSILRNFYLNARDRKREWKERRPAWPLNEVEPLTGYEAKQRKTHQDIHRHFPE